MQEVGPYGAERDLLGPLLGPSFKPHLEMRSTMAADAVTVTSGSWDGAFSAPIVRRILRRSAS